MQEGPKVTVVIATKNEEPSVESAILGARRHSDEVILIDGHSTDGTRAIAEKHHVKWYLDNKRGKGAAIRLGIEKAKGDIIVFMDADGSHDPDDIPKLLLPLREDGFDLVLGSRTRGGSDELHGDLEKFLRMIGSDIITLVINYRWNVRLTDSQNGFRAIRASVVRKLGLREDIFTIEQEMIMRCLRNGFRVCDVPTHEYARRHGSSRIVLWKVAPRYVWCLLRGILTPDRRRPHGTS
ncbi:glycosyltransferase family 2 protein [Planctomycetota bacterium]